MELTWFRRPAVDRPGTLNLCYNAVDRQVVGGAAEQVAVRHAGGEVDFAGVLERSAALAGAMRGMGVAPGSVVAVVLDDPYDRLLAVLAALRLGAVISTRSTSEVGSTTDPGSTTEATLAVVDRAGVDAAVRIHRALPVEDETREVDWDLAYRAGRTDPASCADVSGDAPAYLLEGGTVATQDVLDDGSWLGRAVATLAAGRLLDLAPDDRES